MLELYKPKLEDMSFRQQLLADEETMSYNHAYGGTIEFPQNKWQSWYERWLDDADHFYRYLYDPKSACFIGEVAIHRENDRFITSIIIMARYRHHGYGSAALTLLFQKAQKLGIEVLYDDIAIDNKAALKLFLKHGFKIISQDEQCIMVKKTICSS